MLTFDYAVKYNGKYYPPNTPIVENPVEKVENEKEPAPVVEKPVENVENPKPRKKRGTKE